MAKERVREFLSGPPDPEYFAQKASAGWRLVSVDWERETKAPAAPAQPTEPAPFGLQVADDCVHLAENAGEKRALMLIMELVVQDRPLSQVADELNRLGHRTRAGHAWSPNAIFELLPRLIEVGPKIFDNEEYVARKRSRAGAD
jgi:hypothetical protein